ncbi:hypothetical protein CPC16_008755 [Podila verticillata]|nr:hypothetical protein BGZ52_006632 [Haplosporangium bisporale]KAF9200018.1 hypothetical protein BGZ59_003566 [Podila verticillata]KAF9383805.1 hypothetical protein CPC16_008755 [Podila verticillata]KAI9237476.1 MAG: hypothetical protein BYD32DRAFT_416349 [Podila humilis]KFH63431.1 hypothetical protein MVEG_10841 [Podila verticillata NRRL 6337]
MAKFSTLLAFIATATLLLSSTSVEAVPFADPKIPAFSVYPLSNLAGTSKFISKYGCHNHGLTTIGSVHYHSGPKAQLTFFTGKNCKGTASHAMSSDTVKQMGGPYKSQSVMVAK